MYFTEEYVLCILLLTNLAQMVIRYCILSILFISNLLPSIFNFTLVTCLDCLLALWRFQLFPTWNQLKDWKHRTVWKQASWAGPHLQTKTGIWNLIYLYPPVLKILHIYCVHSHFPFSMSKRTNISEVEVLVLTQ